jgi:hypothetical protein
VSGETAALSKRTLPSPMPTRIPADLGELANRGSQLAEGPVNVGATWNLEAGPVT